MSQAAGKKVRGGTRARLLEAARLELVEGGGDVEVAKVAKRAGASDGLAYYHFGNKTGLLNAIVSEFYQALDDKVVGVPFAGETWAEREKARTYAMVEYFYNDPVAMLIATRLRTEPAFAAEEAERSNRLNELGATNIAQAQRAGEIDADFDPLLLVASMLAGLMAGIRVALEMEPPMPLAEAQAALWAFVARTAGLTP
ncbi:MAG: TetR/AcrR family transcriptional regulator [Pseudomonadota bacterium]